MSVIERIVIENFKSLRNVELRLGRMNLFIGTNASGKSNFLDALRVLQGIGNGFSINETLNGKPKGATSEAWEGIRGGSAHALFSGAKGTNQVEIGAYGMLEASSPLKWKYHVAFLPLDGGKVTKEHLEVGKHMRSFSWDTDLGLYHIEAARGRSPLLRPHAFGNSDNEAEFQERLQRLPEDMLPEDMRTELLVHERSSNALAKSLSNVQRIDPDPRILRSYSQPLEVHRMGERGENFAALVKTICENEETKGSYLSWLRELRPAEVDDVGTLAGAVGEPMFMLRENGRDFPAPILSDGTLRFTAITSAFFQPEPPSVMMIEEIENGIHPSRLQLLMELLRSRAGYGATQIMATTHSPLMLDWLQEDEYATTFLCRRDEATGESSILPLTEVPRFMDVAKNHPVSELLSEGWLETVS